MPTKSAIDVYCHNLITCSKIKPVPVRALKTHCTFTLINTREALSRIALRTSQVENQTRVNNNYSHVLFLKHIVTNNLCLICNLRKDSHCVRNTQMSARINQVLWLAARLQHGSQFVDYQLQTIFLLNQCYRAGTQQIVLLSAGWRKTICAIKFDETFGGFIPEKRNKLCALRPLTTRSCTTRTKNPGKVAAIVTHPIHHGVRIARLLLRRSTLVRNGLLAAAKHVKDRTENVQLLA